MKYRDEIDGLRALAVVPVVLFHAGFELFSGGFVGVDVFFVISGYLITSILIDDIQNKQFNIVKFYEKRARRILPAMFFVMLSCIPFAYIFFNPLQFREFSQSIFAAAMFLSNFFFYIKADYFGLSAEEKPLLHTWSLAVEEQYYLLFPLFLIFTWRFGKNNVFLMIVVIAAVSLLLSEWGWRHNAAANFYLIPTRAYELLAGSVAAIVIQKHGILNNNMLASVGLAVIIFAIFLFDETTPFPSIHALVPVLGAMFVVLFAGQKTFVAKVLRIKLLSWMGLISYSVYLWHQPALVFAKAAIGNELGHEHFLILFSGIIGISYISWKYLESPFRNPDIISRRQIFVLGISFFLMFSTFGLSIHFMNYQTIGRFQLNSGILYATDFDLLKRESIAFTEQYAYEDMSDFESSKFRLLIVGDSIADDFTAAVRISTELNDIFEVRHLNYDDLCFDPHYSSNECTTWRNNFVEKSSLFEQADVIAVVVGLHPESDIASVAYDFRTFRDKMILVGSAHFNDPFEVFQNVNNSEDLGVLLADNKHVPTLESNSRARVILQGVEIGFVSLYDFVCANENYCEAADSDGTLLIFDTAHRTRAGIEYLSEQLSENYRVIFQNLDFSHL